LFISLPLAIYKSQKRHNCDAIFFVLTNRALQKKFATAFWKK